MTARRLAPRPVIVSPEERRAVRTLSLRGGRADSSIAPMLERLELALRPKQTFELDLAFFDEYRK
jgi:hypothetical protein